MDNEQQRAVLTICLMAAVADGVTSPKEREFLAGLAQVLGLDAGAAQQVTQHAEAGRSPSRRARSM